MEKWIALTLIVAGFAAYAPAKPPGEFGYPLHVIAGIISLAVGVCWLAVLIFIRV